MTSAMQRLCLASRRACFPVHRMYYGTDRIHPGYKNLKKNQERFQVEDGCPIHLKKGIFDKALYYTTLICGFVGVALSFKEAYCLIYPSKKKDTENESEDDN